MSRLNARVKPVSAVKKVAMTTRPTTKLRFWYSDGSMTGWSLRRSDQTNRARTTSEPTMRTHVQAGQPSSRPWTSGTMSIAEASVSRVTPRRSSRALRFSPVSRGR